MGPDSSPAAPAPGHESPDGRAILRGNMAWLVLVVLRSRRLLGSALSLAATVFRRFFFDQFAFKLRPGAVPVRNIEHPLDAAIPVRYEAAKLYLTFVQLWISALGYLRRRIGPAFDDDIVGFMAGLDRCYTDASGVYGRCLSTTRRPARAPSLRLAFVYAVDPHLFCVPSLHVLVVCYTYRRLAVMLEARGLGGQFSRELSALRSRAVAITESILYVRQHSVNCIPTALAMLSVIEPSFDATESKAFMADLFAEEGGIAPGLRAEALAYMDGLYDRLVSRGGGREVVYGAIADFVLGYAGMNPGLTQAAPGMIVD